jgi:uncharacterized membrane protein
MFDNTPIQDPYSLDTFIAWLETMPAEGEYNYWDCGDCLVGQYATALGIPDSWFDIHSANHSQFGLIAALSPCTFGSALERAKAMRG